MRSAGRARARPPPHEAHGPRIDGPEKIGAANAALASATSAFQRCGQAAADLEFEVGIPRLDGGDDVLVEPLAAAEVEGQGARQFRQSARVADGIRPECRSRDGTGSLEDLCASLKTLRPPATAASMPRAVSSLACMARTISRTSSTDAPPSSAWKRDVEIQFKRLDEVRIDLDQISLEPLEAGEVGIENDRLGFP